MQILKISLYGYNGERRDVDFVPSQVNIITGASKKGKSSLIDIVEYCLGSSECNVAAGYIQQTVAWYAVLLQFPDTEVFIAREAPVKSRKSNSVCHMLISKSISVPEKSELEYSTNITSVVAFLTSKLGIPEQLTEVPEGQTRANIQVGFKHSLFYLFQGQDEIAAKRILFHRQAEPFIPQVIKDTLPYFMGAAEDDRLSELENLRSLKREKSKLLKRIKEIESIQGEGLLRGFELLAEASGVGIYKGDLRPNDVNLLHILQQINTWVPTDSADEMGDDNIFYKLDQQYREFSAQKKIVRSKLHAASEYAGSLGGFEGELNEQSLRLQSIGLYKSISSSSVCPICETIHEEATKPESIIQSSIYELNSKLDGVSRSKPRISSYLQSLRKEDQNLADKIKKIRDAMEVLRKQEVELLTKAHLDDKRSRVVGRISLYLESVIWSDSINSFRGKLDSLLSQIEELEENLDPAALKEKLESQLSCVAEDMTKWARELGLEHSEHPIRLDVSKLTVVAETPNGRTPLSKMGSGENWVGYHLVTYLALAKWFIEQKRPVGRFIFFDQPTQVYFPSDQAITGDIREIVKDEDREAVKKIFKWIFRMVSDLSPNLQIIITEHADIEEEWFQSAVADTKWRGDDALIPKHWYE